LKPTINGGQTPVLISTLQTKTLCQNLKFFFGGGISSLMMQSLIVEFGSRERRFYFDELSKPYCQPRNCKKRFDKDTVGAALEQTSTYFASKLEAN